MIVTHTQNANGQRRVYLNGKSSLECWIEPKPDNIGWSFHLERAVTGNQISDTDAKTWATHTLLALAAELGVSPDNLASVSFEAIAALHSSDPFAGRRTPAPKRRTIEQGYMAAPPEIRRPQGQFTANTYASARQRQR